MTALLFLVSGDAVFTPCVLSRSRSASGTAALLDPAREHRGGRGRLGQPHLRRGRVADAVRALAARLGRRADWRRRRQRADADRQERAAAERCPTHGHLHVRRVVRARQHRTPRRGPRQRSARPLRELVVMPPPHEGILG